MKMEDEVMNKEWKMVRLGEVGQIITGNTPKTSIIANYESKDISFYKPSDLTNCVDFLNSSEYKVSTYAYNNSRQLPKGSVLVSCIGIIGKVGILNESAICNQQINAIIPNKDISSSYIAYYIIHNRLRLQSIANAPVVPIINKSTFSDIKIPLPCFETQQQIAATLDKASELIQKRKAQLAELDALAESIFYDMFGDPVANEKGWEVKKVGDICKSVNYGTSLPANEKGKYVYLRMNNITYSGELDLTSIKYIDIPESNIEKYVVRKGDILFNRTNSKELVGKTTFIQDDSEMIIAGYIIRIRVCESVLPVFFSRYMNSTYIKLYLRNLCRNIIGQANINAKELQCIPIILPPLHLQQQFAERIEKIEQQKQKVKAALKESQDLFQRLMQDMFNPEYHNS